MGKRATRAASIALVSSVILVCCIEANTLECGDLACPEALQCRANRCVTDEQVEACRDHAESDPCVAPGLINGHCVGEACVDSICGNGLIELGEICDDGNTAGEDGCAMRCDSTELCGNGVVDLFHEQCDEGIGTLSGDGCSSRCAVEYATWQRQTPHELAGRSGHAMATLTRATAGANRILLFGGGTSTTAETNETWVWNGVQWRQLQPRTNPPARSNAMLVYDPARDRVVLFGGGALRDVWEWDGVDWTNRTPTANIVPATGQPLGAYHAATGQLIVYDGAATFRWNGTSWFKLSVSGPPIRNGAAMAYHAISPTAGQLVLFGGRGGGTLLADTWAFDGTGWREVLGAGPGARDAAMMATNTDTGRVALFGGRDLGGAVRNDTWVFDGAWAQIAAATSGRRSAAMAYDPNLGRWLLVHGIGANTALPLADQASFSGAAWNLVSEPSGPSSGCTPAFVYVPAHGEAVFVGGGAPSHRWDGIQWSAAATYPTPRCSSGIAALPAGDRAVLFGGYGSAAPSALSDTWSWNGMGWSQLPVTGPAPRSDLAIAPDERRRTAVLVGGLGAPGSGGGSDAMVYGDTWDWDGLAWTARPTSPGPARFRHALAYDRTTGSVVLFGGMPASLAVESSQETWELDGAIWRQLATPHTPRSSGQVLMATGPRGRPILVDSARTTWELVRTPTGDVDWVEVPAIGAPPVLAFESIMYDPAREQVLLEGVANGQLQLWSLTFQSPHPRETCAATVDRDGDGARGCGDATYPADPDCWAICDPVCSPHETVACDPARIRCGDGMCSAIEDYQACPADCPAP